MSERTIDLVGIGECLAEFSHIGDGNYQLGYSGDVLNALAAAGRLGLSTGLITAIGDDPFQVGLLDILNEEHIDLSYAPILKGKPNGIYFVYVNESGGPSFHFLRKNSAAREAFVCQPLSELIDYALSARALLFSSIPLAVMNERERIFEMLAAIKGKTIIAFDMNVRRALWPDFQDLISMFPLLASLVDVLFVTNEDDEILFGARDMNDAMEDYKQRGFNQIVIRRGNASTLAFADGESFHVPVPKVANIVDTTGAGDVFNAGYIAAMLRGHQPYECAAMGNATAAVSVDTRGGRARGVTIDRVETLYRPLVKWGTFHGPAKR
jgi:2-dehydro-3-deoxygluconokinase